jgi:hypothetical protein
VLDVFSHVIVGWHVATHLRTDLAPDPVADGDLATPTKGQDLARLTHHSGRDVPQLEAHHYRQNHRGKLTKFPTNPRRFTHQMVTSLHDREAAAPTNFAGALKRLDSGLAQELTKDPYALDFLAVNSDAPPSGSLSRACRPHPRYAARARSGVRVRRPPGPP